MGLASSQVTLLMLTSRKADCEYDMAIASNRKMALAREASNLSREYNSRLNTKNLAFFANGAYQELNYQYLMGYSSIVNDEIFAGRADNPLKSNFNSVLTDYKGAVVLSDEYAQIIRNFAGCGEGKSFTMDSMKLAQMIAKAGGFDPASDSLMILTVLDGGNIELNAAGKVINSATGTTISAKTIDVSGGVQEYIQKIIDFYKPIFMAAATNGWTTEYNSSMTANKDYIGDALTSGVFQLAQVFDNGSYFEDTSITYFLTTGVIEEVNDSEARADVTAWYEAEKAVINEKETQLDVYITELSTELEAITTEMESIQSFIDDAVGTVFDWGAG